MLVPTRPPRTAGPGAFHRAEPTPSVADRFDDSPLRIRVAVRTFRLVPFVPFALQCAPGVALARPPSTFPVWLSAAHFPACALVLNGFPVRSTVAANRQVWDAERRAENIKCLPTRIAPFREFGAVQPGSPAARAVVSSGMPPSPLSSAPEQKTAPQSAFGSMAKPWQAHPSRVGRDEAIRSRVSILPAHFSTHANGNNKHRILSVCHP